MNAASWLENAVAAARSTGPLALTELEAAWAELTQLDHLQRKLALAHVLALHRLHGGEVAWRPLLAQLAALATRLIERGKMADAEHRTKNDRAADCRQLMGVDI